MPLNLEPLLSDSRVGELAQAVRLQFPDLPDDATFLTYYQEPIEAAPECAVFGIKVQNPRHPEFDKFFWARTPFRSWQMEHKANRHEKALIGDPAYAIYCRLAPQVIEWHTNTRELI